MTDEELVKRLRDLGDRAAFEPHMHHEAADRIEALTAENKRLGQQCEGLMQAGMNNGQALIIAEAKLAKAVEALKEALYFLNPTESDMEKRAGIYRIVTTLAEIEGDSHD